MFSTGSVQICKKCVLDSRFPGIGFDRDGVCNVCRSSKKIDTRQELKKRYEEKFTGLIRRYKGKSVYDCLVAYSGGKDSTYTLYMMKNKYNLNILAVSFNNWFQSERAFMNIHNVLEHINVDHFTVTPNFENFRKILQASMSNDLYSKKALERATTICTTCLSMIRFICFKIAIEKEIPFIILGLSPGQAPVSSSVFKSNSRMMRGMQNAVLLPLKKHVGDIMNPYFLEERHFEKEYSFPYIINPLAFSDYDEDAIYAVVRSLGWEKPDDTDANSSNCLLNSFANQNHLDKFGFHPYAFEVAELVRIGSMTREEGLARLNNSGNPEIIEQVKEKLRL